MGALQQHQPAAYMRAAGHLDVSQDYFGRRVVWAWHRDGVRKRMFFHLYCCIYGLATLSQYLFLTGDGYNSASQTSRDAPSAVRMG